MSCHGVSPFWTKAARNRRGALFKKTHWSEWVSSLVSVWLPVPVGSDKHAIVAFLAHRRVEQVGRLALASDGGICWSGPASPRYRSIARVRQGQGRRNESVEFCAWNSKRRPRDGRCLNCSGASKARYVEWGRMRTGSFLPPTR